jgi:FMN-binding domain
MRRALLAVALTVAGLVALLSFKTASGELERPTGAVATGGSGPSGSSGTLGSSGSSAGAGQPTAAPASPSVSPLPPGARAITGRVASTVYGPVQVQVVVKGQKIVGVNILQRPDATEMDIQIGQYALPQLIAETLAAQSARIDTISGATYTSGGYINSLQNALDSGA